MMKTTPSGGRLALAGVLCLALGGTVGYLAAHQPPDAVQDIRIDAATMTFQIENRAAILGRALTKAERQAILDRQIQREVLVHEAARLGLHLKDQDMRKHLVGLMNHVLFTEVPEPDAAQLGSYHAENRDRYLFPATVTFEHVFFPEDREAAEALANAAVAGQDVPYDAGKTFWLGRRMEYYTQYQLLSLFGHDFAETMKTLPIDKWAGPIQSARGWHVVRVEALHPPAPLPDDELDRRLREDWKKDWLNQQYDAQVAALAEKYRILMPN